MSKHISPRVVTAAFQLRAQGLSYAEIGRRVGFTGQSVRRALDPAYAERRRQQINVARRERGGDRPCAKLTEPDFDQGSYSQPVYRKFVPNRTALGSAPLTAKGEGFWITLPMVSILRGEL